jgi:hypothetical protein
LSEVAGWPGRTPKGVCPGWPGGRSGVNRRRGDASQLPLRPWGLGPAPRHLMEGTPPASSAGEEGRSWPGCAVEATRLSRSLGRPERGKKKKKRLLLVAVARIGRRLSSGGAGGVHHGPRCGAATGPVVPQGPAGPLVVWSESRMQKGEPRGSHPEDSPDAAGDPTSAPPRPGPGPSRRLRPWRPW